MLGAVARKLFGSSNDRRIRTYQPRVAEINALEAEVAALSDDALRARTDEFRKQIAEGAELDDLLAPAFATVREAAKRAIGQRHFDVQLIGGMVLHEGRIAEMKTGEGKTLVATLPCYLNALSGKGVHVVTVNDYLAKRDAEWMAKLYGYMGLSTGVVVPQQGGNKLFLYELWENRAALDVHANTDRIKAHRAATKELVAESKLNLCDVKHGGA